MSDFCVSKSVYDGRAQGLDTWKNIKECGGGRLGVVAHGLGGSVGTSKRGKATHAFLETLYTIDEIFSFYTACFGSFLFLI